MLLSSIITFLLSSENPPQVETPEDDVETGGGGKRWVRVWPVSSGEAFVALSQSRNNSRPPCSHRSLHPTKKIGLGKYGKDTAVFLARSREVCN